MSAVLRKTTAPCVTVHFRNICFGRGSFLHTSQALRPEKRGSPLPMGRTGTDFIPLTLHCVRTRPAGKEVRLRLDFFDACFFLSGSVVHFVTDTSSEGVRKRETVTDSVPFHCTPSLPDSQSGIATFVTPLSVVPGLYAPGTSVPALRRRDLHRLRRAHSGLVSVHGSNPSASTPSLKPLPPARLTRPKCVAVPR